MADVHRLRDIGRAEINYDGFWFIRPSHSKTLIQSKFVKTTADKFRRKSEIDKARTSDFRYRSDVAHCHLRGNQSGQISRVLLEFFAKHHRHIGLVISVPQIRRWG